MLIKFDDNKSNLYEFIVNCDKAVAIVKEESKLIIFSIIETKLTDNTRALVRNRMLSEWVELKRC